MTESAPIPLVPLGPTLERLRCLLVSALRLDGLAPEEIAVDAPLFGDGLGLDSVDALELVVAVEREFGVAIPSTAIGAEAFASLRALAELVARLETSAERGDA